MFAQYPEKFYKAKDFVNQLHREGRELSDESQLVLYALGRQVEDGACKEPKPSAWNAKERALWQAWDHLGQMSKEEAMRLYVKQLEIDVPKWWSEPSALEDGDGTLGSSAIGGSSTTTSGALSPPRIEILKHETQSGKPSPKPRYEHGSLCVGSNMYVIGGRSGGRYLNDCWVFNLKTKTWTEKKWKEVDQSNKMAFLPALASASYLHSSGLKCIVVGGHTKPDHRTPDMKVYKADLASMEVEKCNSFGDDIPTARGGHTSVLVRSQVFVFGGEETSSKKLMGDLHVYDLHSSTWTKVKATNGAPPCARSAHSATVFKDKYVVIFGGGSVSRCFNDVHVLDTQSMEWFAPEVVAAEGSTNNLPAPRAGHASVLLGSQWYIIGGGNNTSACTDLYVLDLSALEERRSVSWKDLGDVSPESSLSCEGASLTSTSDNSMAIGFGGYNGKYLDRLCCLHRKHTLVPTTTSTPANANANGKDGDKGGDDVEELRRELERTKVELEDECNKVAALRKKVARLEEEIERRSSSPLPVSQNGQEEVEYEAEIEAEAPVLTPENEGMREQELTSTPTAEKSQSSGGLWGYLSGTG